MLMGVVLNMVYGNACILVQVNTPFDAWIHYFLFNNAPPPCMKFTSLSKYVRAHP